MRENAGVRRLTIDDSRLTIEKAEANHHASNRQSRAARRLDCSPPTGTSSRCRSTASPICLPEDACRANRTSPTCANLTPSPITSVHLWFDRPVMSLPHAVLVDCLGQWVFNRGEVAPGEFYLQVVVERIGAS